MSASTFSQMSSFHQSDTEVQQAPNLPPENEASRPKKVNHCSVAKRVHVFELLQGKKFNQKPDHELQDQQPWRPCPARTDLVKGPQREMPQGPEQEEGK